MLSADNIRPATGEAIPRGAEQWLLRLMARRRELTFPTRSDSEPRAMMATVWPVAPAARQREEHLYARS
jgi:hypothetical protein